MKGLGFSLFLMDMNVKLMLVTCAAFWVTENLYDNTKHLRQN